MGKRTPKTPQETNQDINNDETLDMQDNTSNLSLKLDRRRRIEEINEERRLRKELSEF